MRKFAVVFLLLLSLASDAQIQVIQTRSGATGAGITAPTIVSHASTVFNTTGTSKTITPAGWNTGDIVAVVAIDEGVSNEAFSVPTATGLTFTAVINHQAASNPALIISTATAGSTCSSSCVITQTLNNAGFNWGMTVYVIRGSSGIGNNASQFTATRTVSLTPVQADSTIIWGVGDWAAAATTGMSPTPTNTDVITQVGTNYTAYIGELTDQTSTSATPYGITGSGTGPFSIGVVEVKGQ